MSHTTYILVRPFSGKLSISNLSLLLRAVKVAQRVATGVMAIVVLVAGTQLAYTQWRPQNVAPAVNTSTGKDAVGLQSSQSADTVRQGAAGILKTLSEGKQAPAVVDPTAANAELTAIINNWVQAHPGMQASVMLNEIDGRGRSATYNATGLLPTASIYKLFVAWYVLQGIEDGSINKDTAVVNGKNVEQCLHDMIINSDNPCGETLGYRYGWTTIDNFAASNGYGATILNATPPKTTAADIAGLLQRLHDGQLLNTLDTQMLLSYMGQQIYRQAIPAGTPGATVQNKVGFGGSTWNDAAIITTPKTTYILVVLTQNGGSNAIKDLATQLHAKMDT